MRRRVQSGINEWTCILHQCLICLINGLLPLILLAELLLLHILWRLRGKLLGILLSVFLLGLLYVLLLRVLLLLGVLMLRLLNILLLGVLLLLEQFISLPVEQGLLLGRRRARGIYRIQGIDNGLIEKEIG